MVPNLSGAARGGFPPMTPSAMFLPVWTQSSSRVASWPGPKPSLSCCPRRWWPLTGRRPRRSHDCAGGKGAMHLVSAWATQHTLTLAQNQDGGWSPMRLRASPQLLEGLDVQVSPRQLRDLPVGVESVLPVHGGLAWTRLQAQRWSGRAGRTVKLQVVASEMAHDKESPAARWPSRTELDASPTAGTFRLDG